MSKYCNGNCIISFVEYQYGNMSVGEFCMLC